VAQQRRGTDLSDREHRMCITGAEWSLLALGCLFCWLGESVLTDNWPVDFIYISRRIVTEIVQQHEAGGPERVSMIDVSARLPLGPGIRISSSRRPIDYTNYFDLAKRATAAVSDHTGWLASDRTDRIPTGPYVRAKMHLQEQKVPMPLTAWEKAHSHPIAVFVGTETFPGVGRVFLGLAGSASNFMRAYGGPVPPQN